MNTRTAQITIRPAYADDYDALVRLAALDSAGGVPPRPLLIAEVDGEPAGRAVAARRHPIADPSRPPRGFVALLRAHAAGEAGP